MTCRRAFIGYGFILTALCVAGFASAADQKGDKKKDAKREPKALVSRQIGFDPMGLPRDREIPAFGKIDKRPDSDSIVAVFDSLSAPQDIYAAQIVITDVYSDALLEKVIAEELFNEPVRLEFEAPFFKVRVAEFRTRAEADAFLAGPVRGLGYPDATVVRARLRGDRGTPPSANGRGH